MKRFFILIFIIFLGSACLGQRFIGSVIAGVNGTQVDGDEVAGFYKWGVNAGASVMLPLDRKMRWFATVELLYTQKGAYQNAYRANAILRPDSNNVLYYHNEDKTVPFNQDVKYKLTLDYVEVPVLFHYEDFHTGWGFGLGFSWGRLVNVKEIENGWTTTTNLRSKTYSRNDWSVLADLKIKIWKGLKLNIRYQYSLVPLRIREYKKPATGETWTRKEYNNVITFRLIYSFNEKYVRNPEYVKGGRRGPQWIRDTSKNWYNNN